jgi:multicomponent K+:H+ antiporter subunit D
VLFAVATAGLPPLGGFLGKALLLGAVAPTGSDAVLWGVVLLASLLNLIALARAGSRLFWQPAPAGQVAPTADPPPAGERLALALLLTALAAVAVLAADLTRWSLLTAADLHRAEAYREAVLGQTPLPTTVPR